MRHKILPVLGIAALALLLSCGSETNSANATIEGEEANLSSMGSSALVSSLVLSSSSVPPSFHQVSSSALNISSAAPSSSSGCTSLWVNNTLTDCRDGRTYKTTTIGNQTWMAENLAYLPSVNKLEKLSKTEDRYYVYSYDGTDTAAARKIPQYSSYGVLYNWPAARMACPSGWHLSSSQEWRVLYKFAGDNYLAGDKLKAKDCWMTYGVVNAVDSYGFSAKPGGLVDVADIDFVVDQGAFDWDGEKGYWWTAEGDGPSDAITYYLQFNGSSLENGVAPVEQGMSVRCVLD